jgi:SPX domain protein involved in polyphosphate accumulation
MAQTVEQVLTRATDSVTLINSINTDGSSSNFWFSVDVTQEEINEMVQRNVDHLEIILAYAPVDEDDDTPDVVGDSSDKSSYTDAIATGNSYISNNS